MYKNEQRFERWYRDISNFHHVDGTLEAGETQTFSATMPDGFFTTPGTNLVQAYLQTDPPNGFSTAYGKYFAYTSVRVFGTKGSYLPYPINYRMTCRDRVIVTVTNTGEWGDRTVALYLDGDLKNAWQTMIVKAGETQTFTSEPIPAGTVLIEADVHGHRDLESMLDYHAARTYCIP